MAERCRACKFPRSVIVQPEDESVRYIALTQGKYAIVDSADYDWLMQWAWCACRNGQYWYAKRTSVRESGKRVWPPMHRVIMGEPPDLLVDHINGETLDNRRSNLRLATVRQNQQNRKINCANKSGYKGVCKQLNRWLARITIDGRHVLLGSFTTPELAHAAYVEAAERHFGEFARPC